MLLRGDALAPWPVGRHALGRVPRGFLQRREEWLRRDVAGREEAWVGDLAQPPPIRLDRHAVLGQRLGRVLDGERLVPHPDRRSCSSEPPLPIEAPMAKAHAAVRIEHAGGPEAEQPIEIGRIAPGALHPAEHRGGSGSSAKRTSPSARRFGSTCRRATSQRLSVKRKCTPSHRH